MEKVSPVTSFLCSFCFNHSAACPEADELIWLVMWEAGLIIQVPAGVLILYPSALLLHFNFDISSRSHLSLALVYLHNIE